MQLKWIIAIIVTAIIVGVTGNTFMDYKGKTDQIGAFLNSYGNSFAVSYDDVKMTSFGSDIFTIKNLSITSKNLSVQSSNATINFNDIQHGKFSIQNANFKYFDYTGNAENIYVHNLNLGNKDKDISISLNKVTINGKGNLIDNAEMNIQVKQAYDKFQLDSGLTTFDGDQLTVSLKSTLDKKSVDNNLIYDGLKKGVVNEVNIDVKNVTAFNKLIKEYPSIKSDLNSYAVKFVQHHYPKAKKAGMDMMDFLKDQKTLNISIKPSADLTPYDFLQLKAIDSLTLFDALNLEITK
ncbi:hypothetical protein AB3A98_004145 [Vibrio parahaemolyticus]